MSKLFIQLFKLQSMPPEIWFEIFVEPKKMADLDALMAIIQSTGDYTMLESEEGFSFALPPGTDVEIFMEDVRENYPDLPFEYTVTEVPDDNWNEAWESTFEPVRIKAKSNSDITFCSIRASFHDPVPAKHEIIINPSMSFGTGHHETTALMIQCMESISFGNKMVLDFGSGSGVLAILAHKMGARHVLAIDNDTRAVINASENFTINNTSGIKLMQATIDEIEIGAYDVILANIQKNVIVNAMPTLYKQLNSGGHMLLSGLLVENGEEIAKIAGREGFTLKEILRNNKWIAALFIKNWL
jgi:ribosomal protein L11 methyltransferase